MFVDENILVDDIFVKISRTCHIHKVYFIAEISLFENVVIYRNLSRLTSMTC